MLMRNLVMLSLLIPALAHAGGSKLAGVATEKTQWLNNGLLADSKREEIKQTLYQFNMYRAMMQNLKKSTPSSMLDSVALKLWNDNRMNDSFMRLFRVVVNGRQSAVSAETAFEIYRKMHPGYGNFGNFDYGQAYRDWSDTNRYAIESALRSTSINADDLVSEADMIRELQSQSRSADGQMQILKAGNDIGVSMVGQMQKLRQLQMAQMQAQNTVQMNEQARKDSSDATLQRFIDSNKDYTPPKRNTDTGIWRFK